MEEMIRQAIQQTADWISARPMSNDFAESFQGRSSKSRVQAIGISIEQDASLLAVKRKRM